MVTLRALQARPWFLNAVFMSAFFQYYKESVKFSHSAMSNSLWLHGLQYTRPPCSSPTPRIYPNSCPLSRECHPTTSTSVVPFSRLQSFPASGSFPMSQVLESGGQSIGVSPSASVLPMNIKDWFSLGWTGWISLQSKGLSRVFSNNTVKKHQFFGFGIVNKTEVDVFSGTLLLFQWSSGWWQFDLWFLCLF